MANFGRILQGIGSGLAGAGKSITDYTQDRERTEIAKGYLDQQRKELIQQEKRHNDQMLYQYKLPKALDALTEVTEAAARGNSKLADELWLNNSGFVNQAFSQLGINAPSLNLIKARGEEAYQAQLGINSFFSRMFDHSKEVTSDDVNNALDAMRKLGIDHMKAFNVINPLVENQRNAYNEKHSGFTVNGQELTKDQAKLGISAGLEAAGNASGGKIPLVKPTAKIDPAALKTMMDQYDLPAPVATKIAGARDAISGNLKVIKNYEKMLANDKDTGIVASLIDDAASKFTGKRDEDMATLKQALQNSNLSYVKAMAGTTFTDRLLDYISQSRPGTKFSPETFRAMLAGTVASDWVALSNAFKDPEISGKKLNPEAVRSVLRDNAAGIIFDDAGVFTPESLKEMLGKAQFTQEELKRVINKMPASVQEALANSIQQ